MFCNQGRISGCLHQPDQDEIREIIESRLATMLPGNRVEIGFFGGNFTGIDRGLQETCLSIAQEYITKGFVDGIRLSTRPDYISTDSLALLGKYSVKTIELGAQSMDDEVLRLSGRGHSATDIRYASALILKSGFRLGLQMMTGLPGDTLEKSIFTARQIVSLGASETRIYPTLVIRDTRLEELYHSGLYSPLSLDEAVAWTVPLIRIFETSGIRILRVGLHPSDYLLKGNSLVVGPFHVAFGEMVYSELWKDELRERLREAPEISDVGFRMSDVGFRISDFGFQNSDLVAEPACLVQSGRPVEATVAEPVEATVAEPVEATVAEPVEAMAPRNEMYTESPVKG
jgi:histone acetyltransferase (RNA polymerase elongator complex component)